jgi:hypothetical protein
VEAVVVVEGVDGFHAFYAVRPHVRLADGHHVDIGFV